jgi:predicted nucleotidyltransferase
MYTPEFRDQLREVLLDRARHDARITAAAITGSAAAGAQDAYSDIDLAFAIQSKDVIEDWTSYLYSVHGALHHLDMPFGTWLYRVFLLPGTLQLDVAFVDPAEFRPLAPTFQLVFGEARPAPPPQATNSDAAIGLAWLYALHVRSAIARGKVWQAEYMISGLRDTAFALACTRHGLPSVHAKGIDQLPVPLQKQFEAALVCRLDVSELSRPFGAAIELLISEIHSADATLAYRLEQSLRSLY